MSQVPSPLPPGIQRIGRYLVHAPIASGGMGSVHLGRVRGAGGFSRVIAIKRMHAHIAQDPAAVAGFLDEARLVARIRHPNVVPTLDVVSEGGEMLLVMEYVEGDSLHTLQKAMRRAERVLDVGIALAIVVAALRGLHAAHEARSENGEPLHIVHRDVSPQNILVGTDGTSRVVDFGVAKAAQRLSHTDEGLIKGKLAYMAPEQVRSEPVDRRADVYSAGVLLWEALVGERLFAVTGLPLVHAVLQGDIPAPSSRRSDISVELDAIVLRACARHADQRYATAEELADALETVGPVASQGVVARWVRPLVESTMQSRTRAVAELESAFLRFGETLAMPPAAAVPPFGQAPPPASAAPGDTDFSVVAAPRWSPSSRLVAVGGAAAAVLAAALVLLFSLRTRQSETTESTAGAAAAKSAATTTQAYSAHEPPVPPVASASAVPAIPAASASTQAAVPPKGKTTGRIEAEKKPPKRAGCDPPYELAADGRKRFKPECF